MLALLVTSFLSLTTNWELPVPKALRLYLDQTDPSHLITAIRPDGKSIVLPVTPLAFDSRMPTQFCSLTIAGGTFPYTLGELTIRLEDRQRTYMNVTIIAKFTQDGGKLSIPLTLGLRGGFLDGRKLLGEPDTIAPFGQKWVLEDP